MLTPTFGALKPAATLQHDLNNKLGLFVSYRKGNYDMNGKGKYYYSTVGSEIDIDSYLAGLYYRYDRNNWWTFATVYGGMQKRTSRPKTASSRIPTVPSSAAALSWVMTMQSTKPCT